MLLGWLVDLFVDWIVDCLVDWLVVRCVVRMSCSLVGVLIGLVGLLDG